MSFLGRWFGGRKRGRSAAVSARVEELAGQIDERVPKLSKT